MLKEIFEYAGILALIFLLSAGFAGYKGFPVKTHKLFAMLAACFALVHLGIFLYFKFSR